ncbi:MAG: short-chain dehydrogenase/reductase [Marmoricola sp.]|nr:short-chain dehydrogenase/reductase [Marmoricola sp.]
MTTIDNTPAADFRALASLEGRTAVVVGAGNGIGRQTAHALTAAGATVVCVDVDRDRAEAVASEVGGVALVADACEREGVAEILSVADAQAGPLAAVVDIVGASAFAYLEEHDDALWERSWRINMRHAVLLAEMAGPALAKAGGGSLVYVASVSGMFAAQRHAAYGAHKAALISLMKTAAVEHGPRGVRVNAVAPGVIWTERIGGAIGEERRQDFLGGTPIGRLGEPSDVASVISFLSTDMARHVTGQVVVIDGGLGVRFPYPVELF